jgi:hypothetical protein
MGLRAAPTEDTGVSAAEIVFGAPLVLPGADTGRGRAAAGRLHRQTAASRSAAAFTSPLLRTDGSQAAGGAALSGIRVHPEGRHGPPLVAALQRPVQGPRLGPEGVPAAGGRAGRVGLH